MSRDTNADQSFVAARAKVRAAQITAAATIPEQAERPGCRSDTSANVAEPDKRNRQPPGEWTREPPTEAGWYWLRDTYPYTAPMQYWIATLPAGAIQHDYVERWSVRLEPPC
jgi:hypothetical protein